MNCNNWRRFKKTLICLAPSSFVFIPAVVATSCSSDELTISNMPNLSEGFFERENLTVDLSKLSYDFTQNISSTFNDVWVRENNIDQLDPDEYADYIEVPTNINELVMKLIYDTVNWDVMFPQEIQSAKSNAKFSILSVTDSINGGVVINYRVALNNVKYSNGTRVKPTRENGLLKSGTISLKGFKPYRSTDFDESSSEQLNKFEISVKTNINYFDLSTSLNDKFFTNEFTYEQRREELYKLVRDNWSSFFSIDYGIISASDSVESAKVFDESLKLIIGPSESSNTGSYPLKIIGMPIVEGNTVSFKFNYVSQGTGYKGDFIESSSPTITLNTNLSSPSTGMEMTSIIGMSLSLGGGVLLLIAMIILLVKKSKKSKEVIDYEGEIVNYPLENNFNGGMLNSPEYFDSEELSLAYEETSDLDPTTMIYGDETSLYTQQVDFVNDATTENDYPIDENNQEKLC